jgi:hypothetical protein
VSVATLLARNAAVSATAKIASATNRFARFFNGEQEAPLVAPVARLAVELKGKTVAIPVIDLTGRLASFAVTGNDAVTAQLNDGQRWKRELAGASASPNDPNDKLRIPTSAATSVPVTQL